MVREGGGFEDSLRDEKELESDEVARKKRRGSSEQIDWDSLNHQNACDRVMRNAATKMS